MKPFRLNNICPNHGWTLVEISPAVVRKRQGKGDWAQIAQRVPKEFKQSGKIDSDS